MKRPERIVPWSLALVLVSTCSGLDTFEITEETSATLPRASLVEQLAGDLGFGGFLNMDVSQNQELKNQGVEKHEIDSVRIQSFTLTVTDPPSGQDFAFLESIQFFVEAEGLERKPVARGGPFPPGATSVELALEDLELAPYVAAPSMSITSSATGRRPANETTVRAALRLKVDVNVSGVACGGD